MKYANSLHNKAGVQIPTCMLGIEIMCTNILSSVIAYK